MDDRPTADFSTSALAYIFRLKVAAGFEDVSDESIVPYLNSKGRFLGFLVLIKRRGGG